MIETQNMPEIVKYIRLLTVNILNWMIQKNYATN